MRKLALIVILLLLLGGLGVAAWLLRCPSEVQTEIGEFNSKDEGLRASIPVLAREVRKCPKAELYLIIWIGPGENGQPMAHSTLYQRRNRVVGVVGYEEDLYSGASEPGYVVDDSAIQAVADKGGTLSNFAEYVKNHK